MVDTVLVDLTATTTTRINQSIVHQSTITSTGLDMTHMTTTSVPYHRLEMDTSTTRIPCQVSMAIRGCPPSTLMTIDRPFRHKCHTGLMMIDLGHQKTRLISMTRLTKNKEVIGIKLIQHTLIHYDTVFNRFLIKVWI